jgi:hypothetical protein
MTAPSAPHPRQQRTFSFSSPSGLAVVAVVITALVAIGFLLWPMLSPALPSDGSASPTEQTSPSQVPSPSPTPEPTAAPTAVPTPTPTPVAQWTGLEWSAPVTPSLAVVDAIRWSGRYVGVGYTVPANDPAPPHGTTIIPVFLNSVDGVTWTVVHELESYVDQGQSWFHPVRVVPVGDGLVAMGGYLWGGGPRALWESSDGIAWTAIDSPSWQDGWDGGHARGIAGGPSGTVVIGAQGSGCCLNPDGPAIIGHSTDGRTWTWLDDSPAFAHASFTDVEATTDGFVLVGWIGQTEAEAREGSIDAEPMGRPAAWTSPDGVSWIAAAVAGQESTGGRLTEVVVGADGLFATGIGGAHEYPWVPTSGWASVDGRSWDTVGALGAELPGVRVLTSDGTRMVILGPESASTTALAGWTSTDGRNWTRLTFSGAAAPVADLPEGPVAHSGALKPELYEEAWPTTRLTGDGLVAHGWVPVGPTWEDGTANAAWIARAVER